MRLPGVSRWEDACTAAAILAIDPLGIGGISLRSAAGPVRDRWLQELSRLVPARAPLLRIPLHVTDARLLGGLDLAATVRRGRPVAERGLLEEADGGVMVMAMSERLSPAVAAKVCTALDTREVIVERDGFARRVATRFALVGLDEGIEPEERPPQLLLERLALHIDLNGIPIGVAGGIGISGSDVARARNTLSSINVPDELTVALCEAADVVGIESPRACLLALRVARAAAALAGRMTVTEEDAAAAARLVFAPRARKAPREQPEPQPQTPATEAPDNRTEPEELPTGPLAERIVEAALANLPADFCAHLQQLAAANAQSRQSGRRAGESESQLRGRPVGTRAGDPRTGARMSVIETLRAAAPWQLLRRRSGPRMRVTKQDFRVIRCKRRNLLTTIFVVDASGSAALHRLAEVKGAVELMLAESYVRRDRVALIAFRGKGAQILLQPTHSLARVKRELASLPAGGGTPTACGLDTAGGLADTLLRRGEAPVVVVLTDGGPNVARDGRCNRARAEADTVNAARLIRCNAIASVLVDTAPQPRMMTEQLAREMGARYVPLPHVSAGDLASVIQRCRVDGRASGQQMYA